MYKQNSINPSQAFNYMMTMQFKNAHNKKKQRGAASSYAGNETMQSGLQSKNNLQIPGSKQTLQSKLRGASYRNIAIVGPNKSIKNGDLNNKESRAENNQQSKSYVMAKKKTGHENRVDFIAKQSSRNIFSSEIQNRRNIYTSSQQQRSKRLRNNFMVNRQLN